MRTKTAKLLISVYDGITESAAMEAILRVLKVGRIEQSYPYMTAFPQDGIVVEARHYEGTDLFRVVPYKIRRRQTGESEHAS